MGAIGWGATLEKIRDDADVGGIAERLEEFVEIFANFISYYSSGPTGQSELDYFFDGAYDERFLYVSESEISFAIADYSPHTAERLCYLTQLAFACEKEAFEAILIEHGFQIDKYEPIESALRKDSDRAPYFVTLRDQMWSYWPKYNQLSNDDAQLELEDLDEEERALIDAIAEDKTSRDAATSMLTPSGDFEDALIKLAYSGSSDEVGTAYWYGANVAFVSDALLEACLNNAMSRKTELLRFDARKIELMAKRAEDSALDAIRAALASDDLAKRALATAAIVGFERDDVDTTLLKKRAVEQGLVADAPYCDVAVSYIFALSPDAEGRQALNDALVERLSAGLSPSTEHDFVLAIVNLWMSERAAPPNALTTLQTFAAKEGHEAQGIAQWGLAVLGG